MARCFNITADFWIPIMFMFPYTSANDEIVSFA